MKYNKKELCLIWLDSFLGLEYKHKKELCPIIEEKADIPSMLEVAKDYLITQVGENEYRTLKTSANREYLERILLDYQKKDVQIITFFSDNYPESFINITCPPLVIYCKGDTSLLSEELFAIVGSRKSLTASLAVAKNYTEELMSVGFTLVTGIAEGVDAEVLKTALSCGGKVISVIAGGFDNIYPANHQDLFDKVCENGLAISEYPPLVVPKPYIFPVRNRLIAGLSKGVLVASAALKSGTMYTAEYAIDSGRDLFAVPYSVGVPSGAGCNDLIKKGAILTDNPQDIIEFYGKTKHTEEKKLDEKEIEIVRVLLDGALHIDKICACLNKRVFEIMPTLSILEIKGIVTKSANVYQLTTNHLEA